MKRRSLFTFLFCSIAATVFAQKPIAPKKRIDTSGEQDLIDVARSVFKIRNKNPGEPDRNKSFYFSFLPSSPSLAGTGRALITSTTAGFYLGDRKTTYLSDIVFTPYFNFRGRYGIPLRSDLWLKDNSWDIQGDTRFLVYPQYTWGLGGNQPNSNRILLNYKYIRLYQDALKRITSYLFAGLGYNYDDHLDIESTRHNINQFTGYHYGTANNNNSVSAGPNMEVLYDTRNNDLNPMPGVYANAVYRVNTPAFGSNAAWQSLYVDLRKYISLTSNGPKNILAFWSYYWTVVNGRAPYLDLPSVGWDPYNRSGRGLPQNRYKGKGLLYFEGEYRRDITGNGLLGFVLFSNINSVTQPRNGEFVYWNPAGGGGLRLKFNKNSNTNIALDYGFSKDYRTVRLNLGEAF